MTKAAEAVTDQNGVFEFAELSKGRYTLELPARPEHRRDIEVGTYGCEPGNFVLPRPAYAADQRKWHIGRLIDVARRGKSYDYRIVLNNDRYTGRSPKQLRVAAASAIQFAISGDNIYIVDQDGTPQKLRYVLQEMLPPLPPPPER